MLRDRLLDELHVIVSEEIDHAHGMRSGPRRVRIDTESLVRSCIAHYPHYFHVAIGAELHLENRVLCRVRDALSQPIVIRNPDGVAGLSAVAGVESPELVHG